MLLDRIKRDKNERAGKHQVGLTHHLAGQEESRDAHELEAVGSHGRGCQEAVHDVHCQAAALKRQMEVLVDRDEPADEHAAVLSSQLRGKMLKKSTTGLKYWMTELVV